MTNNDLEGTVADEDKPKRKISDIIDDIMETIDSLEKFPEWDGVLVESQRCDGLLGYYIDSDKFMEILNLNPCFPSNEDDFGDDFGFSRRRYGHIELNQNETSVFAYMSLIPNRLTWKYMAKNPLLRERL